MPTAKYDRLESQYESLVAQFKRWEIDYRNGAERITNAQSALEDKIAKLREKCNADLEVWTTQQTKLRRLMEANDTKRQDLNLAMFLEKQEHDKTNARTIKLREEAAELERLATDETQVASLFGDITSIIGNITD